MEANEFDKKHQELQVLLSNLDDVCERATKNSLFSEWHQALLDKTQEVLKELNEIAKKEGKPEVEVDLSKYVFKPSELQIDDLVRAYDNYQDAKLTYDAEVLPDYWEIMEKYDKGEISDEEYQKAASHMLNYYTALKNARIELMENIRTATIEDYQERPKDEVDKFLADLEAYNEKLKQYNKLYKEWEKLKEENADPKLIDEKFQALSAMHKDLSAQRPGLIKRRGLIYNPKTLKDLNVQRNMLEEIIKDSTNAKDEDFEKNRDLYEGKLKDTEELIKSIEKFKKAITIKKIKPLENIKPAPVRKPTSGTFILPVYSEGESYNILDELKKLFGEDAKEEDYEITEIKRDNQWVTYEAKKKRKKRDDKPKVDPNKDYDFDPIAEPSFFGPDKGVIPPPPPPPPPPPKEQNKYYNLEELIAKILYGNPPDDSIHYKKSDNFIYMNRDIKLINFPKSHGVSILDKPMKLVKCLITTVVRGIGKLCAKIGNLNKKRRKTIDGLLERIDALTPEEIEFLANNFTANRMTELSKVIPEVAMSALNNKIAIYFSSKLDIVNARIHEYYKNIISKFNRYTEILKQLEEGKLSPAEVEALHKEMNTLDAELCQDIIGLENQKAFAADLNKGGAMSFIENWRVRHNSSLGGRNISKKFEEDAIKPYNYTQIADNVRNGNGYLAAKDFLYGEKIKIAGTQTSRKMKNWFHKTRVGAYEFKPFVELVDYSQDTYWQDILSTLAIAASIYNVMYVKQLQEQLAVAQQRIATLDQTIAAQRQEINLLNQQINNYNQYINQANLQIQANNQSIQQLKNICALYNSDPQQFVDRMREFALLENSKTHGLTEYAMQHSDAGRLGTTALRSSGTFYGTYDSQGHIFSQDICDKINNISNNTALTAQQKAEGIANVLKGVNQNLATTVAAGKADILKGLALPASSKWSFEAFEFAINNIATYDSTFVPSVFEAFVNAAVKVNGLQAVNSILPVQVTSITQIPQLAIQLPTASLIPAIHVLATVVGKETTMAIAESYSTPRNQKTDGTWKEKTDELAEDIKGVDIDIEKEARRIFDEREAEWKQKGPIYRLFHRKEKPTMEQAYIEAAKNERNGRSL